MRRSRQGSGRAPDSRGGETADLRVWRVLCFTTRGAARFGRGAIVGYEPPDWVRDELVLARGNAREAYRISRERSCCTGGTSPFYAWHEFDRSHLADLLVDLAKVLASGQWGPSSFVSPFRLPCRGTSKEPLTAHTLTATLPALMMLYRSQRRPTESASVGRSAHGFLSG